jgi:hypothetical protein
MNVMEIRNRRLDFVIVRYDSAKTMRSHECERGTQECVRHAGLHNQTT